MFINTPDVLDFPYLRWISKEKVQKELDKYQSNVENTSSVAYILPTSEIDSLLGINVTLSRKMGIGNRRFTKPFAINYELERDLKTDVNDKNLETKSLAQQLGYAYVDVFTMYKKIHAESYVGQDGQPVFVKDFYSSDGVYPSAFGQAVITNETIKTINTFYGTDIPYINTSLFLIK